MSALAPSRTMRAAVMYDTDDIRIEARDVPSLEPGDLLIRTGASGVCSGDLMPWYVRRKAPFVFGHEPAGTIVAIEPDAGGAPGERFAVGERVFTHHHAPCLHCEACARGAFVHCATWRATKLDPGGMAEYYRVPRANRVDVLRLPDDVGFADGSLVEPLACVVKSLGRAFAPGAGIAGRTLHVVGAGVMGLMHVAVAAGAGARVIVSDFHAGRLALARRLGAEAAVSPGAAEATVRERFHDGAEAVICGPGNPAVLESAVRSVAPDGTLLMFTPIAPDERFVFDQSSAYFRDLRLVSSYSCGPNDTRESLRLIAAGVVTARLLEATEMAFEDVGEAYRAMAAAEVVKAIVRFPDRLT